MNDFQVQIWKNNYKAPQDKTIQDTFLRVATSVAKAETDKENREVLAKQFYKMMAQWKFVPGGRIIANAGTNNKKATLYNCYVYHPYDFGIRDIDSMQGIFQTLKKSAKILASQGGLGVNLSFIRPNGSYIVGTGARTPGVVKFMELWDKASDVITMGSSKIINDKFSAKAKKKIRKGAMLAAMDISHPEIKDFIIAKQTSNRLTKFNLSVLVPDRFMKAVQNNQMWKLCFPDIQYPNYKQEWDGDLQRWISKGKPVVVYEQMPAKELWDLVMISTYNRNQPGILFYDTINDLNPVGYCQRILTTNPCLTGDTLVAVADGRNAVTIKQLAQEQINFPVYSMGNRIEIKDAKAFKSRQNAQIVRVTLDDGSSFKCTPDHKIMLRDGNYCQAQNLKYGQSLMPFNSYVSNKQYRQISSNIARDRRQYRMIAEYNNLIVDQKTTAIHHRNYNSFDDFIQNLQPISHKQHRKLHSERMRGDNNPMRKWYPNATEEEKVRYHDNMSKSTSRQKNHRWLGKSDEDLKNFISELISKYKRNVSRDQYQRQALIAGYPQTLSFNRERELGCNLLELIHDITRTLGYEVLNSQQLRLNKLYNHKVLSVQKCSNQDVYDVVVPGNNNFGIITSYKDQKFIESSGVFVHNCGEIPQPSNVCNLGSLNLVQFVQDGKFDWQEFQKVIKLAVCFLDDVADISFVPLSEYEQKIKQKRRIGLGVMGLGSLLLMMKLKFGSHEAIQFVDELFKFKSEVQLMTSAFLGKIKGSFTAFDRQKYFTSRWWYELPISYKIKREIENIGQMRNSVHSDTAPTGNSAIFAGQVSNGIEPVFMKEYTRWVTMTDQQVEQLQHRHEDYQMNKFTSGYELQNHIYQKIPNPKLGQWYQTAIFKFAERGNEQILRGQIDGTVYELDRNRGLIKPMQVIDYGWKYVKQHIDSDNYDWCVTTTELSVQDHINMLAASAKYINQNQSKTINIVEDYSYQAFKNVYNSAWKKKIKGVTSYRAGTMTVVLEQKKKLQEQQTQLQKLFKGNNGDIIFQDVKLPEKSYALQYKVRDKNKKKWYFTISFADKELTKPFAFFIRTNNRETNEVADLVIQSMQELLISLGIREDLIVDQRQKYKQQTNVDKIGRAIGMALRHNVPIVKIVETLNNYNDGLSTLMFHVKKLLSGFIKDGTKVSSGMCQSCGSNELVYQSGCSTCSNCGSSKCS